MKIRFFILSLLLLSSFSLLVGQETVDLSIINKGCERLFPGKKVVIDTIAGRRILDLLEQHLKTSPSLAAIIAQKQSADYTYDAYESSFSPSLLFNLGYSSYDTYYREVTVNTSVPVEWDNENPIISNITLPNGGQGIIWLPRPLAWENKDIPLNASIDYRNEIVTSSVGMYYTFPWGLQVSALNYELDNRFQPATYGFSWSSKVTSAFSMPIFKDAGVDGNWQWISKEMSMLDSRIQDESMKAMRNAIVSEVLQDYYLLFLAYEKIMILNRMQAILDIQIKDVDKLTDDQRITVSDNIKIKSQQRNINYEIESAVNSFVYLSQKLDPEQVLNDTIKIYIPYSIDLKKASEEALLLYLHHTSENGMEMLIEKHPSVNISQMTLIQSELNEKYMYNQTLPDFDLTGYAQAFEVNNLGFSSPWDAMAKSVTRPDGVTFNLGLQYTLPLSSQYDEQYKAAIYQRESQQQQVNYTKKSLSDLLKQYIFYVKNSYDYIENTRKDRDINQQIFDTHAQPLFDAKRLNRYDYNTYKSQIEVAKLSMNLARTQYFTYFFEFASDMNIYSGDLLRHLK
jgi:outer membrane protein TolC